ncbi:uncharacterized protein LOC113373823 [Ctenocephalides felis]|uniref:uncharacterized protein LOC113373823 n=1 Tax=Ctenocephalides felis TaxID=7515 RepID=UPI000E6E4CE3|nr:uncharacterized protein LOC113373823 [Ctenocephalides felis]
MSVKTKGTGAYYTLYNEICKCEDLDYLAECLSSDLAQNEKTSKLVRSEAFWRRAFEDRWPHLNKKKAKSKTWLQTYMEMHAAETIENLNPDDCTRKTIDNLQNLCSQHVKELNLTQMVPNNVVDNEHIPISCLLECFPHLTKLHITYSVKDLRRQFEFGCYDPTLLDIKDLANGLANCTHLRSLKIYRTRLCGGTAFLFDSLLRCGLEELSLPHCSLGDEGAAHVASLVQSNAMLRYLDLCDNEIGNIGGQLLASAIFESSNEDSESDELSLLGLSLRLNPIKDEAASKIFKGLTFNKQIKL